MGASFVVNSYSRSLELKRQPQDVSLKVDGGFDLHAYYYINLPTYLLAGTGDLSLTATVTDLLRGLAGIQIFISSAHMDHDHDHDVCTKTES